METQAASEMTPPPASTPWYGTKWARNAALAAGTIALLYAMIYADVVLRARESYAEGEKYMRWHEHPEEKKAELDSKHEKSKAKLDKELAKSKITRDEYDRQIEILQFDRGRQMEESSLKYAYVWYKTAYELFSPPESKWVRLSREKAPVAKAKWKEELRSKNIHFEEYMLE